MRKIILIAGGTSSGKTMVSEILKNEYEKNGLECTLISMDNYYIPLSELPEENGMDVNWDDPNVINWEKFNSDIKSLYEGNDIYKSTYNFETFSHLNEKVKYESKSIIIIEGLFALYSNKIRELSDNKIFVDSSDDIRLIRRINRDSKGRYKNGFYLDKLMDKWVKEIKPMYDAHIKPSINFADIIIKNNTDLNDNGKDLIINSLQKIIMIK